MPSAVVCTTSCTVALVIFVDVTLATTSSPVACAIVLPPLQTFPTMSSTVSGRYSPARCARRGNTMRKSIAEGMIELLDTVEASMVSGMSGSVFYPKSSVIDPVIVV